MARIKGRHRRWSEVEDEIVRTKYLELGTHGLATLLNRSQSSIANRAHRLGVKAFWTESETEILKEHYPFIDNAKKLCELLPGRSVEAIRIKARLLGLAGCELWEDWEEDILRENYGVAPQWKMVELLPGRTAVAIGLKARKLGLHMTARWQEKEEKILRENYGKMTSVELVALLPRRTASSICAKATELGIRAAPSRQWLKSEDNTLITYYKSKSAEEIAGMLPGRTVHSVYNRAQTLGLAQRCKYTANQLFFDKPNVTNSYWAGFIAADGCVTGKQTIAIGLQGQDADHLRRFARDAEYTGPVKVYERTDAQFGVARKRTLADIKISCAPDWLYQLEENFNIGRRKSLTMNPPEKLSHRNALAFIAGYLDGDGWVTISDKKGSGFYITVGFVGTFSTMVWIQEFCDALTPPEGGREGSVPGVNGKIAYYIISGRRAIALIKEILKLDIPRLPRKWEDVVQKFLALKEHGYYQMPLLCNHESRTSG